MIFCSVFACLLIWLQNKRLLAIDTLLGIFAHGALSVGLVVISQMENIQIDIHSFLFGDILTVTLNDLMWIYGVGGIVLGCVIIYWNDLILMTISPDIAIAEGISQLKIHILITGLMTLMVSVSIQIVGVLLVTALLIIPAAAARFISNSPEKMAFFATFIGVLAVLLGISASVFYDTPTGPSIVTGCILLFIISISFYPIKELLMRHHVK
jgi:zinc transport system permease protein